MYKKLFPSRCSLVFTSSSSARFEMYHLEKVDIIGESGTSTTVSWHFLAELCWYWENDVLKEWQRENSTQTNYTKQVVEHKTVICAIRWICDRTSLSARSNIFWTASYKRCKDMAGEKCVEVNMAYLLLLVKIMFTGTERQVELIHSDTW